MTKLKTYQSKRDLNRTREPSGESTESANGQRYVLHKHDASQLHYDLRLEQGGALRSWAIPKGPSLKVGEKRLAVEVEDHPLEYGDFEGVIPQDAYGGGTVMIWDSGAWAPTGKIKSDHIDFVLYGEKLQGAWTLVRMTDKNWLLIKRHESDGSECDAKTLAALGEQSVRSGRNMDCIAAEESDDGKPSDEDADTTALPDPSTLHAARKKKLPQTPQPQLATLVDAAPEGNDWLHEFKFDGYRLLAHLKNGRVQLLTRNDKDWAASFPRLTAAMEQLPVTDALLDGEAVVLNNDGVSDFQRLKDALSAGNTDNVVYQAFDLLHLNGYDLKPASQIQRKQALSQLLAGSGYDKEDKDAPIRYTEHVEGQGPSFYKKACSLKLEGAICKHADSAYSAGRSKQWRKVKCVHDDEFVVGGFTEPEGSRTGFGSLLIGAHDDDGNLIYSGRVGTGFSDRQLSELHDMLKKVERKTAPFENAVPDTHATHWVRPNTVIQVRYTQRTRDGRLRHPSFRGLREDKNVDDVYLPQEQHMPQRTQKTARSQTTSGSKMTAVAGVRLTHPQRVLYPEMGVTKLDLAQYYEAIQDWVVPGLVDRPVSLLRCPKGKDETCFFQKHPGDAIPDHIPRVTLAEKEGEDDYVTVRSIEDVVGLIQAGTLELHVGGSRTDDFERPDSLVFDLDPGPDVAWKETVRVARDFRKRLDDLGLTSFVRITGGKGLHLVVPLTRKVEWDQAKAFSKAVSQQHARTEPKRLTTNMSKDKRHGRIFIDYLRNSRGATAIASYSPRARQGAPVATPLRWDELGNAMPPNRYDINNLRRRLSALGEDPWAGFAKARRPLTKKMLQKVGVD